MTRGANSPCQLRQSECPPTSFTIDRYDQLVPRRRDFDRLERRQLFGWNEQCDASCLPRLALDKTARVQSHDHAMDGRRRDAKEILKVAFRWRPAMQGGIRVDEG